MALNIKNRAVEALVDEVATLAGETKTEAVRRSLAERRDRLRRRHPRAGGRLADLLAREIHPLLPPEVRGRVVTKAEREQILGYGPDGA